MICFIFLLSKYHETSDVLFTVNTAAALGVFPVKWSVDFFAVTFLGSSCRIDTNPHQLFRHIHPFTS